MTNLKLFIMGKSTKGPYTCLVHIIRGYITLINISSNIKLGHLVKVESAWMLYCKNMIPSSVIYIN